MKPKPKSTDSQHLQDDAVTLDNQPKQSCDDDHQSFMLVMEDAAGNEEPFEVNSHEEQDLEIDSNEDKAM